MLATHVRSNNLINFIYYLHTNNVCQYNNSSMHNILPTTAKWCKTNDTAFVGCECNNKRKTVFCYYKCGMIFFTAGRTQFRVVLIFVPLFLFAFTSYCRPNSECGKKKKIIKKNIHIAGCKWMWILRARKARVRATTFMTHTPNDDKFWVYDIFPMQWREVACHEV